MSLLLASKYIVPSHIHLGVYSGFRIISFSNLLLLLLLLLLSLSSSLVVVVVLLLLLLSLLLIFRRC